MRGSFRVDSVRCVATDQPNRYQRIRKSNVVGIKDTLERRKNHPIVFCQIRERMEEFHYCSPDGGCLTVIRLFPAAWSEFHVPVLPAFSPRRTLDASVERKVSRALHRAGIKGQKLGRLSVESCRDG
jgi:hypothetical protein